MTVYADILVVLNLIVDYFLLRLSSHILKRNISVWRIVLSALIGAASSLYIFLPEMPKAIEFIFKTSVCLIMCFTAFGYTKLKIFLRAFFVISAVSFIYGGVMIAVWYTFKPSGMIIHNSVVYFNISPVFLIAFSLLMYGVIILISKITEKSSPYSKYCDIDLVYNKNHATVKAIVDTGNSLEDVFSLAEIIVIDKSVAAAVFDNFPFSEDLKKRYRILPTNTVSGTVLLDGYRCDKAFLNFEGKSIELKAPILAISKTPLIDDYNAIVNPKIFE